MSTQININVNGFETLKQQADEVANQNRNSVKQKEEEAKQSEAVAKARTPAPSAAQTGGAAPVTPSTLDKLSGRTTSPTHVPSESGAPQKDQKAQNLDTSGRHRNDVPIVENTRELVANEDRRCGVVAVQYKLEQIGSVTKLTVGTPNFEHSVEAQLTLDTANMGAPPSVPVTNDIPPVLPVLGLLYQNASTGRWYWEDAGATQSSDSRPPEIATITQVYGFLKVYTGIVDRRYVLPVNRDVCLFVYVFNRATLKHLYSITSTTVVSSVNERLGATSEDISFSAFYDQLSSFNKTRTRVATQSASDYKRLYFLVGKNFVKQVPEPVETFNASTGKGKVALIKRYIEKVVPPLGANDQTSVVATYDTYDRLVTDRTDVPTSDLITETYYPNTYQQEASINLQKWRNSTRYGDYSPANQTLPLHYGILDTDTSYDSRFFTPAVFKYLSGELEVNNNSKNYEYMRENYFPTAPNVFLQQCRVLKEVDGTFISESCQGTRADFDYTKQPPLTINDYVESSKFKRDRRLGVSLNGATYSQVASLLLYSWSWCKSWYTTLMKLGFSAGDLGP